jgi:hypothetical protein
MLKFGRWALVLGILSLALAFGGVFVAIDQPASAAQSDTQQGLISAALGI